MTVVALGECQSRNIIQNAILSYENAKKFVANEYYPVEYPTSGMVKNHSNFIWDIFMFN